VKPEVGVRVPCPASESAEDGEENKREGGGDAQYGRRDLRRREAGRSTLGTAREICWRESDGRRRVESIFHLGCNGDARVSGRGTTSGSGWSADVRGFWPLLPLPAPPHLLGCCSPLTTLFFLFLVFFFFFSFFFSSNDVTLFLKKKKNSKSM